MKKKGKDTLLGIAVIVLIISLVVAGLACFTNIFGDWVDVVTMGVAVLQLLFFAICSLDSCLPQW